MCPEFRAALLSLTSLTLLLVSAVCAGADDASAVGQPSTEQTAFFESRIRPVLVEHCYECHSAQADTIQGGLRLDTRDAMRGGGDTGAAIVPGDVPASLLIEALRYETMEMPPDGKLSETVIADFVRWVEMGAPDPRVQSASTLPANMVLPVSDASRIDWDTARQHWAFQPPQRHESPSQSDAWVLRPLDGFILDRLHHSELQPSPPADRRTLIRRVTFDLIGLPPTPEEVADFVNSDDPEAYEQLVEQLLASPHYGERWAAMWLDLMRYAEDQAHIVGNNRELCYPNAYLYRDWLIGALNDDLPYDQFIRRQLAADLMGAADATEQVSLGFIGLGPKYYSRKSPAVMAEEWENQVDTLTRGLLGLTAACARCHDHKFDPISTADYYALAGVFAGTEMFNRPLTSASELGKNGEAKKPDDACHIVRDIEPRDLQVMIRGDAANLGPKVPRRFLRILSDGEPAEFSKGDSGRRELADAIVDRSNPLTARVIVNRIWSQHFGRPLVATPSNFGTLGDRPTHPELLDDLAVRFMENGWSLKWLHREIMLSATYRQSSIAVVDESSITATGIQRDPASILLWRMNRKRLSVEQWRDAILAVSGRLDERVGGESIDPEDPGSSRRTVYAERSRLQLNRLLALFDVPDPNSHASRRNETSTPLQKLFLLNSPLLVQQAEALAARISERVDDDLERIQQAYQILFGRAPTEEELELGRSFLVDAGPLGWPEYAQALLVSNEMFFLD